MRSTAPCRDSAIRRSSRRRRRGAGARSHGDGRTAPADPRAGRQRLPAHAPVDARRSCPRWRGCRAISRAQVEQLRLAAPLPAGAVQNVRNDMYLAAETIRRLGDEPTAHASTTADADLFAAVQERARRRDRVHSDLGQGRGGDRAGSRHDGRLEAHRRHGRREDRQDPPDLRAGRVGRAGRGGDDRRGRHVRPAGLDDPGAVIWRGRDDGRERSACRWPRSAICCWPGC